MSKKFFAALSTTFLLAFSPGIQKSALADTEPTQMPGTNSWYEFVTPARTMTYEAAKSAAAASWYLGMRGHLVTIESEGENVWLEDHAPASHAYWLGARDIGATELGVRTWQWAVGPSAGSAFTACSQPMWADSCSVVNGAYSNWWTGQWAQPDGRGVDTAVIMRVGERSGYWDDTPDDGSWYLTGYILEFEPTVGQGTSEPVQMLETGNWFQYVPTRLTWDEAALAARSLRFEGRAGHLATPISGSENAFALSLVTGGDMAWLGAKEQSEGLGPRIWKWVEGPLAGRILTTCSERFGFESCQNAPETFASWATSEPNNASGAEVAAIGNYASPVWWQDCKVDQSGCGGNGTGYLVQFEPAAPGVPTALTAKAEDGSASLSWVAGPDSEVPVPRYTVTASPGGRTCTTSTLACAVTGLANRHNYSFTVTATNPSGTSAPSASSNTVMPLAPGFQAWPTNLVLGIGGSTTVNLAQASAGASVTVTGATKSTVTVDSAGFGTFTFTANKAGAQKLTAKYSVKVGKKTSSYSTSTQLYVPSTSGTGNVKVGKAGTFRVSYAPPGASVIFAFSDGRSVSATVDPTGKALAIVNFPSRGAVTYSVAVSGSLIGTGGLTVKP